MLMYSMGMDANVKHYSCTNFRTYVYTNVLTEGVAGGWPGRGAQCITPEEFLTEIIRFSKMPIDITEKI